jgi:hypothetical protein
MNLFVWLLLGLSKQKPFPTSLLGGCAEPKSLWQAHDFIPYNLQLGRSRAALDC